MPECELCHCHAMTVKQLLTDCGNLASFGLRFFDGSNPNTLKQILGKNKVNSNTIELLKESNIYSRTLYKSEEKITNKIQTLRTYLQEDLSLNIVISSLRNVHKHKFFSISCTM